MSDNDGPIGTKDFAKLSDVADDATGPAGLGDGEASGSAVFDRFDVGSFDVGKRGKTVLGLCKKVGSRLMDGSTEGPDVEKLTEEHGLSEPTAYAVRGCLRCLRLEDAPASDAPIYDLVKAVVLRRRGGD